MESAVVGIHRIAAECNIPIPTIRYWAETEGELLGIARTPEGDWRFSPEAVAFFRRLGAPAQPLEPMSKHSTSKESTPTESTPKDPSPRPAAGLAAARATGRASGTGAGHDAGVAPACAATDQTETDAPPPTVSPEVEELQLLIADLYEETKQVQQLLSRLIELLTPMPPPGEKPRVVRAWHPRKVSKG